MQLPGLQRDYFFLQQPPLVALTLIHEWNKQKDVFHLIETSISSRFHPLNLLESPYLLFYSPPANLRDRSQDCRGKGHAVTRCISPKK